MESGSQLLYLTHTAPHSRVRACGDDFLVLVLLSFQLEPLDSLLLEVR